MDHTERKLVLAASSKYAVFLKVVELGSMSKAAMHCNYSQSAVSQIISSLEDELQPVRCNAYLLR